MRRGPALRRALCGLILSLSLVAAPVARACSIALVLAVDVSGSVDEYEYQLQVQGIANALRDDDVRAALLHGQVALALVQWSGAMEQTVSIPFTRMTEPAEVAQMAARIGSLPRAFAGGNTAVGEAIALSVEQFRGVHDCAHWVIDVSGDGDENEGFTVGTERRDAYARGISINGLAIEGAATGQSITNFYRRHVVTPGGFVITAHQHSDFARAMREKMLRELIPPMALAPVPAPDRAAVQLASLAGFLHLQTR
ncbi:MAG: DUF1194 domain-containing protein [Rhodobacteraceae bacterium]|nr:DUF1194 domain-containing protein [Paracoccaceae bacterium]